MFAFNDYLTAIFLLLSAVLYTSVGHAGASAYIAVMSLMGVSAFSIKPTALALNIVVSSYTSYSYIKNKLFDLKLIVPLLIGAVPFAYLGGQLNLPGYIYKPIVGCILIFSAFRFIFNKPIEEVPTKNFNSLAAVFIGAVIGFLSGLTGTGGGIFLSPLLLFLHWGTIRKISGTVAIFILFNSIFGFLGILNSVNNLPDALPLYIGFVLIGAFIGTTFGIKKFSFAGIRNALGAVLLIAGLKLLFNL